MWTHLKKTTLTKLQTFAWQASQKHQHLQNICGLRRPSGSVFSHALRQSSVAEALAGDIPVTWQWCSIALSRGALGETASAVTSEIYWDYGAALAREISLGPGNRDAKMMSKTLAAPWHHRLGIVAAPSPVVPTCPKKKSTEV